MNLKDRIYIAGHQGLVGSAIVRNLKAKGFKNIITAERSQLNLLDQTAVQEFFKENNFDYVLVATAKVGEFSPIAPTPQILFTKKFNDSDSCHSFRLPKQSKEAFILRK